MPELPEVETVIRDLRPVLLGKRLASVQVGGLSLRRQWKDEWSELVAGRRVTELTRRGKWIVIALDNGLNLLFHLGMTGQLQVTAAKIPPTPHTHFVFPLDRGGKQLRFRDIRRFGSVSLFSSADEVAEFFANASLGPEPFELPKKYLFQKIATSKRCLKAVLLDQKVVAGVGNIYADESLFEARLHPAQLSRYTSPTEATRLSHALGKVLKRAIEQRGATIRDYIGGSGLKGKFQEEFAVYGRGGRPCQRCRTTIEKMRLAGRATHYCPVCQKNGRTK